MFKGQIANFKKYSQLLKQLVSRDLKTRYRRSVLGFLWTILNPLGMMIIMTIVFSTVFRQGIENFPVYLMCGQLIFNFFSEASTGAMGAILDNSGLLTKVYVPKYLFPLSRICSSAVNLLFSMVALIIVIIATKFKLSWTIILMILPITYVCIFAFGIGLVLATTVVYFRDMRHLYGIIITAWVDLTPIFYPMSMLPENVKRIVSLNPLTKYVEMFRQTIMYGQVPTLSANLKCLVISFTALIIGMVVFKKNQEKFILHF